MKRFKNETFVVFDLEWTNYKRKNYIIEIGALKIKNGEIIDKFDNLLRLDVPINKVIVELTGITQEMLVSKGEKRDNALLLFKLFIEDSILVAHDVRNDMKVLKEEFERLDVDLPNSSLCTLKIAKNIFLIKRHNLESVAQFLNIDTSTIHRGLADVKIAYEIFKRGISLLPKNVKTVQDLKNFDKIYKKIKAPTFSENIDNIDSSKKYRSYFFGSNSKESDSIAVSFKIFHETDLV